MKTKFIAIKELQRNLSQVLREAQEERVHFVVMRHNEPIGEFIPLSKGDTKKRKEIAMEELYNDIAEARSEAAKGQLHSTDEVRRMLGI